MSTPQENLWSQVTPLVVSGIGLAITMTLAWYQRKLNGHVRKHRDRLGDLENSHQELRQRVTQKSESASGGSSPRV